MRLSLSSEILSSHCTKNISKWDTTVKPKKRENGHKGKEGGKSARTLEASYNDWPEGITGFKSLKNEKNHKN